MAFTNIHNYLKRLSEGHLHDKLRNLTIFKKNKKEKEEYISPCLFSHLAPV